MGNYRFRLSDMMPNAWFYKLKDMSSRGRRCHSSLKKHRPNVAVAPSSSYSPRTSSSSAHKSRRKTIYRPSPTPVWTLPTHIPARSPYDDDDDIDASPEPDYLYRRLQHHRRPSHSSSESDSDGDALASFDCKLTSSTTDIIIDINQDQSTSTNTTPRPILPVPPILTKASFTRPRPRPRPRSRASSTSSSQEQTRKTSPARTRKPGIKVRGNSPRIQVAQAQARKSISSVKFSNKNLADSFAVVKSSVDPQKDFWESMVEMIVENDISASKDLEDLLACYLSLNPPYYHPHIVEAFERIWFHMSLT
ncbi:transcription repressor OFP2 [Rhodamnia argentea]|uniref:Transcription repressor n=1 Tax=Rhodamnia argentea TaxID=178133 RepID=A0A8B8PRS8_9MYRT|nr:transcription repressor OFP2 [Rhodamnia argentea]